MDLIDYVCIVQYHINFFRKTINEISNFFFKIIINSIGVRLVTSRDSWSIVQHGP